MKKMIFFTDLDDTLLNRRKEISPGNRAAIDELHRRGHIIAISTGRALPSGLEQARRLGLDTENCYVIAYNGGEIYDCGTGQAIDRQGLPLAVVREIFDEAHRFPIHIQTYDEKGVLAERDTEDLSKYKVYQNLPGKVVEDVTRTLTGPPPKVLAADYAHPERVSEFRAAIAPKLEGRADVFLSHAELLEFVPPGINKGYAVRFLCEYLGIPLEHSVAAGDAENDLTLIQAAHVGCAMCNGEEQVRRAADYVTRNDCDHDGVAELLHRFILDAGDTL